MRVLLELEGGEPWSQRTASILARQSQWSAYGTKCEFAAAQQIVRSLGYC
jgi:hypothetical protein